MTSYHEQLIGEESVGNAITTRLKYLTANPTRLFSTITRAAIGIQALDLKKNKNVPFSEALDATLERLSSTTRKNDDTVNFLSPILSNFSIATLPFISLEVIEKVFFLNKLKLTHFDPDKIAKYIKGLSFLTSFAKLHPHVTTAIFVVIELAFISKYLYSYQSFESDFNSLDRDTNARVMAEGLKVIPIAEKLWVKLKGGAATN